MGRWKQGVETERGRLGGLGRGSIDPSSGIGRTWAPKSDKTEIQTRFMCSAAECERAEVGDRKVFQVSDP